MVENQLNKKDEPRSSWLDFVALILSFFGAIVSIGGALLISSSQAQSPLWPLPGFVLLDWALLGFIGFLAVYLSFRQSSTRWMQLTLIITGALIPLIVLGVLSIGSIVLISFLFFVISTIILSIRKKAKWLESAGIFMLGAIGNLGLLLIIITLGNRNY